VVAVLVAGCAADPVETAFFPQHPTPLGAGYEAALEGRLVLQNSCLWISVSGLHVLVVWPSNTSFGKINDLPAVLGPDQELLVEVGSLVRLGGRSVDLETAQELAGRQFPRGCADSDFWVASSVESTPPATAEQTAMPTTGRPAYFVRSGTDSFAGDYIVMPTTMVSIEYQVYGNCAFGVKLFAEPTPADNVTSPTVTVTGPEQHGTWLLAIEPTERYAVAAGGDGCSWLVTIRDGA
jgi:hypothetical protein